MVTASRWELRVRDTRYRSVTGTGNSGKGTCVNGDEQAVEYSIESWLVFAKHGGHKCESVWTAPAAEPSRAESHAKRQPEKCLRKLCKKKRVKTRAPGHVEARELHK